ncbi:MAG: ribonuclease R [Chitinophagaceae bacterium]
MGRKNTKKKKSNAAQQAVHRSYEGVIEITRSGLAYVVVPNQSNDILVRPNDIGNALHGDTVAVKVIKENMSSGRREGRVVGVIERKQTVFIGKVQLSKGFGFLLVKSDKPMPDLYLPQGNLLGAKDGDMAVASLIQWEPDDKKPVAKIIRILADGDANEMVMQELLAQNGFPLAFPDDVMEEAARIPDIIPTTEIKHRKDFRDTLTFTIDPLDAKDFDDAISIKKIKKDIYEIGVHIADVSYYVQPDTALDEEAYRRATSVYLPDRVSPMLPEHISNVLCSLRPNEDKCTFSAVFQISTKGEVKHFWLGKTLIHSNHRYTYEDAQAIIEGTSDGPYKEEILLLNQIAQKLRKQRFSNGAINFSSQEVRFKLDEHAKPIGIVVKESKEAHQLIEEFMLLANKTVAAYVAEVKVNSVAVPFPYRIHDRPDEEKLQPFIEYARRFGISFNIQTPKSIAESFNAMLAQVQGKPEQAVLEQLGIRTMAKAIYSTQNIGHYGLAFEFYSHFTSPIRRYPDVLVHRILESCLKERPTIDKKLEEKCKHCSERERAAMECERAANKYKQVEFMKAFIGETFDAVVTGVSSFGFWAETVEHKCEGLVSVTSLNDYDDFMHIESDYALVGKRSGRKFSMGDKVKVKLVAANLDKRQLDYEWVLTDLLPSDSAKGKQPKAKADKVKKKGAVKKPKPSK